ncbi:MAG: hypothetical protein RhofKO_41390 [Rhodothermales bacterium]
MPSWAILFLTLLSLAGIILGGQLVVDPDPPLDGEATEALYTPPDPLQQSIRIAPDAEEREIADALQAPLIALLRQYEGQNVEITEAMRPYITQIAELMEPHHQASLTVTLFATEYDIAQQRAEHVQTAFVRAGLPGYVVRVQGDAGTPSVFVTP